MTAAGLPAGTALGRAEALLAHLDGQTPPSRVRFIDELLDLYNGTAARPARALIAEALHAASRVAALEPGTAREQVALIVAELRLAWGDGATSRPIRSLWSP